MIKNTKLTNEYIGIKRRFADSLFIYQLYTLLAAVSFFGIGYYGVYKPFIILKEKIALEKQLLQVNQSMQSNLDTFAKLQNDTLTTTNLTSGLSDFMPSTYSTEEYVVQLAEAVSSSGFILRRISSNYTTSDSGAPTVSISVKVDGPGNPVDLVKNIEKLKRITKVVSFAYIYNTHSSVQGDGDANIGLEIYTSAGEQQ